MEAQKPKPIEPKKENENLLINNSFSFQPSDKESSSNTSVNFKRRDSSKRASITQSNTIEEPKIADPVNEEIERLKKQVSELTHQNTKLKSLNSHVSQSESSAPTERDSSLKKLP